MLNLHLISYMVNRDHTVENKKKSKKKSKVETGSGAKKGIMLSFFRTHPYLLSLLMKRRIDTKDIIFIDTLLNAGSIPRTSYS